ncbi:multiple coagulation factor deficiency protein 2 homolog [Halyomorpha halys]|uniref:multiple coagulation factor deficiency protein 2 homolog n=1 Tax=Halyomorpha halys TaxID=286706 RepID=UPI0006D52327|nr:multiple coagulation factor deficiency protein 2 homolog isoform X1 [Halyomorpha halys]
MMLFMVLQGILMFVCQMVVEGRGPHHPHGSPHYRPTPGSPKITMDADLLHDTGHIQEDLGKSVNIEDLNRLSPEELEFQYFKIHDYDNNTKLDGLEILQAIRHTIEHSNTGELSKGAHDNIGNKSLTIPEDFNYFVDLIDQVLEEDDHDRDGYLSYTEYVVGRQRG